MKGNKPKCTKEEVRDAIEGTNGILAVLAKKLGVTYVTVYNYLNQWPELKEDLERERERVKDVVELEFIRLIEQGNTKAILQAAKTLLKGRGYGYSFELAGVTQPNMNTIMDAVYAKIERGGEPLEQNTDTDED